MSSGQTANEGSLRDRTMARRFLLQNQREFYFDILDESKAAQE